MRMGSIGFFLFWLMIGSALMQVIGLSQRLRDPYLKGVAVFILILIIQELIFGYLDLQWTNYRNLIALGILFALLGKLNTWDSRTDGATDRPGTKAHGSVVPAKAA